MIRTLSALLGLLIFAPPAFASCEAGRVDLRGEWGMARFSVELADDPKERSAGLMFRESMASGAGMLFVYERPQRAVFWMKNTLIPLDMIFMDATGTVTKIHEKAKPLDETGIDGGEDVLFVLEINGGLAGRMGITEGSEMRHPSVGATAAWPCD